ncbi:C-methyltransferase C-terminal domain/Methyltransferase domain [Actinoalloteichus sp. GBA129-24]|uniref:C-methyltransferase C-terminal domain/Methyltransferase domain n=2 Tax=Pseudonocardiaceae TaxID=2070 RepID=A0AAC9LFT1_9PSEU|nr:C-methyltransferase C-terminal domain/Methyltransferase domain [Actinoalloteichus fjordicus]APU21587.1 C-methyltransferase C-terminal domain/Methyltransferase domain [Actinoalloteichus sp. GBA129-24]
MVQLIDEMPQELRYHAEYRYHASGSAGHRRHFAENARRLLATELTGRDPFIVEIGSNDGVLLASIAQAGIRHLGVEPSATVAEVAESKGVQVLRAFFDERTAEAIRSGHGMADVVFGANTICHIAHIDSVLRGVDALLAPHGVFVFEEPYLGTVIEGTAFDQIYDEHVLYFSVTSVQAMAAHFGFELVDVEPTPLHGGEIRYTLARVGARAVQPSVPRMIGEELTRKLTDPATFERFGRTVERIREDLVTLLTRLRAAGKRVVGYGAPGKCATVTNYCDIRPDLVPFVCDSTPAKQGRLVPGSHLPVRPPAAFSDPYPDYALLFAWNHADEIMAKEQDFRAGGGQWIRYVPEVHIV